MQVIPKHLMWIYFMLENLMVDLLPPLTIHLPPYPSVLSFFNILTEANKVLE